FLYILQPLGYESCQWVLPFKPRGCNLFSNTLNFYSGQLWDQVRHDGCWLAWWILVGVCWLVWRCWAWLW
ncbi:hypothetical protein ACVBE9_03015, partial [Eionea flava]